MRILRRALAPVLVTAGAVGLLMAGPVAGVAASAGPAAVASGGASPAYTFMHS